MPRNDQIARRRRLLRRLDASIGLTLHRLVESIPEDVLKDARILRYADGGAHVAD
jgi:hypothetical protein